MIPCAKVQISFESVKYHLPLRFRLSQQSSVQESVALQRVRTLLQFNLRSVCLRELQRQLLSEILKDALMVQ